MSAGTKFPLAWVESAAARLPAYWRAESLGLEVVGSVRRKAPMVGDLEMVAPMPDSAGAGGSDELYFRILERLGPSPAKEILFAHTLPVGKLGYAVEGLRQGFRHARLVLTFVRHAGTEARRHGGEDPGPATMTLPVEIYRYDAPGRGIAGAEAGNGGWISLERTGPAEFGRAFLARWKRVHGIGAEGKGSDKGYLRRADGSPVGTADERECFALCQMPYVAPERRGGELPAREWVA